MNSPACSPEPHFPADETADDLHPAHPAATVIIFHEQSGAAYPRLLMVQRSTAMRFAAGMAVFPGGRVDDDDHVCAGRFATHLRDRHDAAARIAAIRETLEETGLAVGLALPEGHAQAEALRSALHAGESFSELLVAVGARIDTTALVPFARWRPNFAHARVFDTRFYITRLSGDLPELSVVNEENSALFWLNAANALEKAERAEIDVIFPTKRNLERLAQYRSFDDAIESARKFPAVRITPFVEEREGESHLCIPDGIGYPVTREPLARAMRG